MRLGCKRLTGRDQVGRVNSVGATLGKVPLRLQHQVGAVDYDLLAAQQQVQRLDELLCPRSCSSCKWW